MTNKESYETLYSGVQKICQALPEVSEGTTFGKPNFRAGKKSFVDFGRLRDGRIYLSFKAELDFGDILVAESPLIKHARYVGQHGWLVLDLTDEVNWDEVESLILGSYRLAALKRMLKALDGLGS